MIPGTQKQHHRRGTHKYFNTLIKSKSDPDVFKKQLKFRRTSLNQRKIYQNPTNNLKWLGLLLALLSVVIISLVFYETELLFENNYKVSNKGETVRSIILILCICQSLTAMMIHMAIDDRFKKSFVENFRDLIKNRSRFKYFFADLIISMIHTPPGIYANLHFTQLGFQSILSYSDILFPFCLLRIKFLILCITQQAPESSNKSLIWMKVFSLESHILFVIKCFIRKWTYSCFMLIFSISLVLLGILLRVFEKHLDQGTAWDMFWISFTTESTVGYGDFYPHTHIGRIFAGIGSIFGVFIFSYSVTATREFSSLSTEEQKLAAFLRYNYKVHKNLQPEAASLIQRFWNAKKSKRLHDFFRFIEFCKEFRQFRLRLHNDLSISLEQQLENSGKVMSKNLKQGKEVFNNMEQIEDKSKILISVAHKNYSKLMKIMKLPDQADERNTLKVFISNRKSEVSATNTAKMRKQAVKHLLARKVNSPYCISPSLSSSSID